MRDDEQTGNRVRSAIHLDGNLSGVCLWFNLPTTAALPGLFGQQLARDGAE